MSKGIVERVHELENKYAITDKTGKKVYSINFVPEDDFQLNELRLEINPDYRRYQVVKRWKAYDNDGNLLIASSSKNRLIRALNYQGYDTTELKKRASLQDSMKFKWGYVQRERNRCR